MHPLAKLTYIAVWLALTFAYPALVLIVLGVDARTGLFMMPFLWLVAVGASAPWFSRALTEFTVRVRPPVITPLPHLPRPLIRLVAEAAAIRRDLGPHRLDANLVRAWELANAVDALGPDLRCTLDQTGASLAPVRELLAGRVERRIPAARQTAHLDAALAGFLRALVTPPAATFRGFAR